MIPKSQLMTTLLAVCPSFEPAWESFVADWQSETEVLPLYLALADFARHVIRMLARGETDTLPAIFAVVERLLIEGEQYVREAATVGLLEDLQNRNLHIVTEPEQFRPFLGSESAKAWDELYRFWDQV